MRKLLFIVAVLISVTAYGQSLHCLNGYLKVEATQMRDDFLTIGKKNRTPTSVWFSRDVIGKILNLLNHEKTSGSHIPDGIRIYFGNNKKLNTVLLVSTYAFGVDDDAFSGTYHQDYFEHGNDALFQTDGVNGEIENYTDTLKGVKLYGPCGKCTADAKCKENRDFHYITRFYGENLVNKFVAANNGDIETNCEWFSLELLSNMDSEMIKNYPADYDGFRIYFGRHDPADYFLPNKDVFVIEATTKSADPKIHDDFFNCNAAAAYYEKLKTKPNKFAITKLYVNQFLSQFQYSDEDKMLTKTTFLSLVTTLLSNGIENGEICPTHCPGTTL